MHRLPSRGGPELQQAAEKAFDGAAWRRGVPRLRGRAARTKADIVEGGWGRGERVNNCNAGRPADRQGQDRLGSRYGVSRTTGTVVTMRRRALGCILRRKVVRRCDIARLHGRAEIAMEVERTRGIRLHPKRRHREQRERVGDERGRGSTPESSELREHSLAFYTARIVFGRTLRKATAALAIATKSRSYAWPQRSRQFSK